MINIMEQKKTIICHPDYLEHKGIEGMRWGYTNGKRNGKRTAKEYMDQATEYNKQADDLEKQAKELRKKSKESSQIAKVTAKHDNDLGYTLGWVAGRLSAPLSSLSNFVRKGKIKVNEWLAGPVDKYGRPRH